MRDLFGSMPVRVKHRALQAEKSSFGRDWDQLLLDLVALFIAWPGAVSLSIRELPTRQSLTLRTTAESWLSDSCRLLHQASLCDSPSASAWVSIGASAPTLTIHGYVCREPVATKRVQFIGLGITPLSNETRSNVLYEEVNKVFADSSFGAIDDDGDSDDDAKEIKMDGFAQRDLKIRKGVDRWPMFFLRMSPASAANQRPLGVDDILDDRQPNLAMLTDLLKAMFYEFLKKNLCQPRKIVTSSKPKPRHPRDNGKSRNVDRSLTNSATSTPEPGHSPVLTQVEEPARKAPRLEALEGKLEPPFAAWSRIKSGQMLPTFKESVQSPSRTQSVSTTSAGRSETTTPNHGSTRSSTPAMTKPSQTPLYDANGKLTRKPFADIDPTTLSSGRTQKSKIAEVSTPQAQQPSQQIHQRSPEDETFEWINPVTKTVSIVNARTGCALSSTSLTLDRRSSDQAREAARIDPKSGESSASTEMTPWMRELINKWKNPVFDLVEKPIPKLPDVSNLFDTEPGPAGHNCNHGLVVFNAGSHHEKSAINLQGRLSKAALQRAELISQVDTKFILAKAPSDQIAGAGQDPRPGVLVLIDQHAADERCRVEELMKNYFNKTVDEYGNDVWKAATSLLPKPLQFEISSQEKGVLHRFQGYFEHWGIYYDVVPDHFGDGEGGDNTTKGTKKIKAKVVVRKLPPVIVERCRTEPRLLAELIRKEAWKLNDEAGLVQQPKPRLVRAGGNETEGPAWVSLFHGCPQGIVELINSRSCRSAIMFNDPLSLDQCARLLGRLVQCAFPFQCAHGRPSMVPLVDLGDGTVEVGSTRDGMVMSENKESFGRKFREWKQLMRASPVS